MAKPNGENIDRMDQVIRMLAEDRINVRKTIAELATGTRRAFGQGAKPSAEGDGQHQTNEQMRERAERFRAEMRERKREADERGRQLDDRIDKLAMEIRELIRNQNQMRG